MQSILPVFLLLLANTTAGYLIPNPPGKYNVTLTTGTLVDYSRNDSGTVPPTPRALMVSVFQPATCASTVQVPYMPNKTAEFQGSYIQEQFNITLNITTFFLEARLPVCQIDSSDCSPLEDVPILLFSPGYGGSRLLYSIIASAIASEGFVVITMDYPEETNIITYPDGHAVESVSPSNLTIDDITAYLNVRVTDASFIIDQLGNATAMGELLPQRGTKPFPTDRIAMLGHSLGGATAVIAAGRDPRVRAAINWDGTQYGSLPSSGVSQPVMYLSHANSTDPSWVAVWPQFKGPKLWIQVANTQHPVFTDVIMLLQAAGQSAMPFADVLGTIAPDALLHILTTYTAEWMNGVFTGKVGGPLLEGKEPGRFPEVSIVTRGNY